MTGFGQAAQAKARQLDGCSESSALKLGLHGIILALLAIASAIENRHA